MSFLITFIQASELINHKRQPIVNTESHLPKQEQKKGDSQIIAELKTSQESMFPLCNTLSPKELRVRSSHLAAFGTDRQRQSKFSYAQRAILSLFGSFLTTSSLLTLFSECFSSFARATCSLSVSGARYSRKKVLAGSLSAVFKLHSQIILL